jgi:hypothetical protein
MGNDRAGRTYEQIVEQLQAAQKKLRDTWIEELRVLEEFDDRHGALSEADVRDYRLRFGADVVGVDVTNRAARRERREEIERRLARS